MRCEHATNNAQLLKHSLNPFWVSIVRLPELQPLKTSELTEQTLPASGAQNTEIISRGSFEGPECEPLSHVAHYDRMHEIVSHYKAVACAILRGHFTDARVLTTNGQGAIHHNIQYNGGQKQFKSTNTDVPGNQVIAQSLVTVNCE